MCDKCDNCDFTDLMIVGYESETNELLNEIKDLRQIIKEEQRQQELIKNELKDMELRIDIIQQQLKSMR